MKLLNNSSYLFPIVVPLASSGNNIKNSLLSILLPSSLISTQFPYVATSPILSSIAANVLYGCVFASIGLAIATYSLVLPLNSDSNSLFNSPACTCLLYFSFTSPTTFPSLS